jgi:ribulose-phosphate 3-epimerase
LIIKDLIGNLQQPIINTMSTIIAPSLLAANFLRLEEEINMVNQSEAEWLHLDIMDGRFVPNISYGMPIVEAAAKICTKILDVHLMIVEPEKYVEQFAALGAQCISVHLEACPNLHRNIQQIKSLGVKAGVALNPHTPIESLEDLIEDLDFVCLMSVNPGFGGQKFIYRTLNKVSRLKSMIRTRNAATLIEVDGGVGLQNAEALIKAGADVLVAGSSVFQAPNPKETIHRLKTMLEHTTL